MPLSEVRRLHVKQAGGQTFDTRVTKQHTKEETDVTLPVATVKIMSSQRSSFVSPVERSIPCRLVAEYYLFTQSYGRWYSRGV